MLLQIGFGLIVQCAFLINFMAVFALYSLAKKEKKKGYCRKVVSKKSRFGQVNKGYVV